MVALTMIPCIAIKITTSSAMALLMTSTADLVGADQKQILMFSTTIWSRIWFLWAPFIGATSKFGKLVPLTVFASMAIIGGLLTVCVYFCESQKLRQIQLQKNIELTIEKGKKG